MDVEDLGNSDDDEMDTGLLSDTSFESLASHFEASYNHRFEEPGAATIASFPRILPSAVRRQDTTRKEARERRKERKEEELRKRQEEVKRMKALKMREIRRKLERVGREAGLKKFNRGNNDEDDEFVDEALKELDLDGEWDPEKHDRQMAGLFDNRDEVGEDDDAWAGEFGDDGELDSDGKPKWDDDIDIGDIAPPDDDAVVFHGDSRKSKGEKKKKKKKKKGEDEDEDEEKPAPPAAKGTGKKGPGAQLAALRAMMEEKKRLEEEARRKEEETRRLVLILRYRVPSLNRLSRRIEEEERRAEEEAKRKEEERIRKKEKEKVCLRAEHNECLSLTRLDPGEERTTEERRQATNTQTKSRT